MRRRKNIIWLPFLLAVSMLTTAQENTPERIIESIIESQLENTDEQTDAALIIEDLERFAENPLNINTATANELSGLYVLTDVQIGKLIEYLAKYGPAYSIYELKTIDGFNPGILQKIEPFIWFGPALKEEKLADAFKNSRNQLLFRTLGTLQEARGYQPDKNGNTAYEGNRHRYYSAYRYKASERLSAGITAEKDPGEPFFKGANKQGFDFYSAHISMNINSIFENIVIGDYLVRAGQGLVIWQGYTSGKSENVLGISKTSQGIRPSTSVDENLFFRGAASTFNIGNLKLDVFYSRKNDDGNVAGTGSTGLFITSLQTSGYHRTSSEIADKNSVCNSNYGGIFSLYHNNLKIGATVAGQRLDLPLIPANQLYNRFRFTGTENLTGGIDYSYVKGIYQLFGEAAISKSKGKAFIQGAVINLGNQLSFSMLLRHFDKNYHALWANTFSEGSNVSNESGLYFGAKILPLKHVALSVYSDYYRSPWINYTTAAPSTGRDLFAQANVVISGKTEIYIRFKTEEKEAKVIRDERYVNLPEKNQKLRLHFTYNHSDNLKLKTRLEHVSYKGLQNENGIMVFQDLQYQPAKFPLSLAARAAWFSTDGYNSRIYAYENDLLYTFSIPANYGRGFRTYLNLRYKIAKNLDCWFKISNTHWTDRETISSGYNEIQGNNKTELKFQLRLTI